MESSMIFCQKNILEHSMSFYGDYKMRCLLRTEVSQILLLTTLISEIKCITSKGFFTHIQLLMGVNYTFECKTAAPQVSNLFFKRTLWFDFNK